MINSKKILSFMRGSSSAERRYLTHLLNFTAQVNQTILEHSISKKEFCEKMKIKPNKFIDFTRGSVDFTLKNVAALSALQFEKIMERKTEEAKEESYVATFPNYKYSEIRKDEIEQELTK